MSAITESYVQQWKNKAGNVPLPKVQFEVHQYDSNDKEVAVFFAEKDLFAVPNYKDYYYRIKPFLGTQRGKVTVEHFGIQTSNEGSNSFDMGVYWNQLLNYLIPRCKNRDDLLYHFNMNLSWHYKKFSNLSKLDYAEFDNRLSAFLRKYSFFERIDDLKDMNEISGLYILVLDDYACCYIGQSKDIKTRIQRHWSKMNFCTDGIDMFKGLDTTRIYALSLEQGIEQRFIDKLEYQFIHAMDRDFLLNSLGGGSSLEFIHSDSPVLGYGCDPIK